MVLATDFQLNSGIGGDAAKDRDAVVATPSSPTTPATGSVSIMILMDSRCYIAGFRTSSAVCYWLEYTTAMKRYYTIPQL